MVELHHVVALISKLISTLRPELYAPFSGGGGERHVTKKIQKRFKVKAGNTIVQMIFEKAATLAI